MEANKNIIWIIVVIFVAIAAYSLGVKRSGPATAPVSTETTTQTNVQTAVNPTPGATTPIVTTPRTTTVTSPKPVLTSGIRIYTPNGGDVWVPGLNMAVEAITAKGINGTIVLSLVDEAKNAYNLGTFKTDPKVDFQRMNVYVPTNRALGKYKIYAVLTVGGTTSSDSSDDYFTITK
jgi:hypothetical protein